MDSALTCILVLDVSMFTTRSCEFTQKYKYSPNNLITDFMNLTNWMFLFIDCRLWAIFIVCFANLHGSPEMKWAPCRPFHTPLWHACCRQTNYVQNIHGWNVPHAAHFTPHFDMLAVDKQIMCKTCTVETFSSQSISLMHTKWGLILQPLKGVFS